MCFLAGLLCVLPLLAQDDQAAIRGMVQKYLDARDKRDAKAVEGLFTSEADQLVSSGEWRKGRDAVVKGTLASSEATGGKRTINVETIRFLTKDAAIADGRYEINDRKMWSTFLMVRTPDGWKIGAIRNMLPAQIVHFFRIRILPFNVLKLASTPPPLIVPYMVRSNCTRNFPSAPPLVVCGCPLESFISKSL